MQQPQQIPHLERIRDEIAAELQARRDPAAVALSQCGKRRGKYKHRCKNRYCPCCLSDTAYRLQRRIEKSMNALLQRYPGASVAMGTFTTTPCDLSDARGQIAAVKSAIKRMFRPVPGAKTSPMLHRKAIAVEAAVEVTPILDDTGQIRWAIHCHSLIIFKPGFPYPGKDYVRKDGSYWNQTWLDTIGPDLYNTAEVTQSYVPLRTLRYAVKSSHNLLWKQYRDPRYRDRSLPAAVIISRADALRGLTLNLSFGLFEKLEELAEIIGTPDV